MELREPVTLDDSGLVLRSTPSRPHPLRSAARNHRQALEKCDTLVASNPRPSILTASLFSISQSSHLQIRTASITSLRSLPLQAYSTMLVAISARVAFFAAILLASGVAGEEPTVDASIEHVDAVEAIIAATCATAPYGKCGSNSDGVSCCPDSYYCLPWDAAFYQCMPQPTQCTKQLTNIDLIGNDIKTIYAIQPADCCTQCTQTAGCVAYTFVNSNPGQPACYLKSAIGTQAANAGAVSGVVNGATPPPPTVAPPPVTTPPTPTPTTSAPACTTAPYGQCGDSNGSSCCPSGQYCQPWNPTFYQCIEKPPRCPSQLTDTDFYGNDLTTVYVSLPSLCCEACAKTAGCTAYTYVNYNPGQPACYLKSSAGTPTRNVGAVSGKLN